MVAIVAAAVAVVGKNHNPLTRVYESNGPDVKIRGTANHVAEKYIQLARDATASGDPVAAENYYQHAEHYFRLIAAAQEQFRQNTPYQQQQPQRAAANSAPTTISTATTTASYSRNPVAANRIPRANISRPYQQRDQQRDSAAGRQQSAPPPEQSQQPAALRAAGSSGPAREYAHDQQPRQDQQPRFDNNRHAQQSGGSDGDVSSLPSFITGGGQPQQNRVRPTAMTRRATASAAAAGVIIATAGWRTG